MHDRAAKTHISRARAAAGAFALAAVLVLLALLSASGEAAPGRTLTFSRYFGASGSAPGRLAGPVGIATDAAGEVYVADSGNGRVEKFNLDGRFLRSWGSPGSGPGQLSQPAGVAIDAQGDVYVADSGNNRVVEFAPDGTLLRQWGTTGSAPGEFDYPSALAIEPGGDLYVTDTGNDRVQRFRPTGGAPVQVLGRSGHGRGQLDSPSGVAIGPRGYVYISDTGNDRVEVFKPAGAFSRVWGRRGPGPGRFDAPQGIAIDPQGNVFVADGGNDRVQLFNARGTFLQEARPRRSSRPLNGPAGVATDCSGRVHVVDGDNNRVATLRARNLARPAADRLDYFHPYVAQNAAIQDVRTDKRLVAITFDDGPSSAYTQKVLDVLARYRAHATFFLVGRFVALYPELVRAEQAAGHELANHTQDHPRLTQLPSDQQQAELTAGERALAPFGVRPRWFRPPYGLFSGQISRMADALGETTIGWHGTLDRYLLRDSAGGVADLLRQVRPGSIILAHDGQRYLDRVVEMLPGMLDGLNRLCLKPTTVGALLHATGFQNVRTGGGAPGVAPAPAEE